MTREEKIAERLISDAELLQEMGYEVMAVFLQGSQNYELDYEGSDIDTKAIVLPKFEDMVIGVPGVSTTHVLPSEEHIDIKDLRMMFDVWKRQNINFLEVLYTQYAWLNPKYEQQLNMLYENRDTIAHASSNTLMKCIYGVMDQKYHALTHPYPACAAEIELYGYASKQLHHLMRGWEFMQRIGAGESFGSALIANDKEYLIRVKAEPGFYKLHEAQRLADSVMAWAKNYLKEYQEKHASDPVAPQDALFNRVLSDTLRIYWEGEWQAQRECEALGIEFCEK